MNYAIALGALLLLGVCYDVARNMTWSTWCRNPGIVVSVILIGVGCALCFFDEHKWALLLIIVGRLVFRVFDRYTRRDPYHVARGIDAGDRSGPSTVVDWPGQPAAVCSIKGGDPAGGVRRVQAIR